MFVCPKELGTLHTRLTKLVLLCQKSQQILSVPNLKIVLTCAHFQTTKYLITTVSMTLKLNTFLQVLFVRKLMSTTILYGKHWLAMTIAHTLFYFFHRYCLCHSSSSLKVRSKSVQLIGKKKAAFQEKQCTLTIKDLLDASELLMSFD